LAPAVGTLVLSGTGSLYPIMALDLGVAVPMLGQIATAVQLVSAGLGLVFGQLADRHGLRWLLVAGVAAAAAALLGFGVAPTFLVLLALTPLGGLAIAVLPSLALAVAGTAFDGADRRRAIGVATAGAAGAAVVGVPVLTMIAADVGWRGALIGAGLAGLAAAGLVAWWTPSRGGSRPASPDRAAAREQLRRLRDQPALLRLFTATFTRSIAWSGLLTYIGALVMGTLGLGPDALAITYLLGGSGYLLGSLLAGRLLSRHGNLATLAALHGLLAGLFALSLSALLGPAPTVALQGVIGFFGAIATVGVATRLVTETPSGVGVTMAWHGMLTNLGAAAGAGIGGVLLGLGGFHLMTVTLPVVALIGAVILGLGAVRIPFARPRPIPSWPHPIPER
jgi:DHA1 family putative efflux transporter-like MFS transporter